MHSCSYRHRLEFSDLCSVINLLVQSKHSQKEKVYLKELTIRIHCFVFFYKHQED
jgi:hypothetical protein